MHSRSLIWSSILATAATSLACSAPSSDDVDSQSNAIYDGVASTEDENFVVRLRTSIGGGISNNCTGSLVAPNLVLTALHCISSFTDGVFTCSPDGDLQNPGIGEPGTIGVIAPPENVLVFTGPTPPWTEPSAIGAEIFSLPTEVICRNDIALVLLDRPVDAPLVALRLNTPTGLRETMSAIGYGQTHTTLSGRFRRDNIPVLAVGQSEYWDEVSLAPDRTFGIGTGPCQGDSGGPALTSRGAVAGVFSLTAGGACQDPSQRNFYTQLAPFERDLILPAFEAAGAEPILEPPAPGEAGTTGEGGETSTSGSGGTAGIASSGTGGTGLVGDAGSADAGSPDVPRGSRRGGGCTCTTAGGEARSTALLGALPALLGLALARRRRRRG